MDTFWPSGFELRRIIRWEMNSVLVASGRPFHISECQLPEASTSTYTSSYSVYAAVKMKSPTISFHHSRISLQLRACMHDLVCGPWNESRTGPDIDSYGFGASVLLIQKSGIATEGVSWFWGWLAHPPPAQGGYAPLHLT